MFVDVYIDESSQTQCRYLMLGGVVIPTEAAPEAAAKLIESRTPELPHGEMKWGKVSRSKMATYTRLVDCFFDDPSFASAQFHSLVVDTSRVNHRAYNDGSSEVGFNKEIYQLASKFARLYGRAYFYIYLDQRNTNQTPDDLRLILNRGRRKAGDPRDWPYRRCQFRNSKNTPLLWVSDIFAGAIAFHLNGHRAKPDASPARSELSDYILYRSGVRNPQIDTAKGGKFTIWHRQLR
ncbi:DUF3800 domain-containing protein [Paracoccus spongiarum]|uniref:DUF3800 domain-containing protein n=1 Tax=Paracoccus spongiarum TaxID=3064387 RepID=A0ABT9J7I6_9RHOB|nr:DUF3800 domain-containing protein [Paracoccus sp. 2205BS29-5]MDP5305772.1 DUF3800 domain-containing protein [Paracoccus sp. 2205BS29-5]